jgi:hypothetical protein
MKKQKLLLRISQIFFLSLIGISILLVIMFYLNTGNVNSDDPLKVQIGQMGPILNYFIYWTYILAAIAIIISVGFPVVQMISNPKGGLKALISLGLLAALMFVTYQLGDGTPLNIAGYDGPDNIPSRLKMTDMIIFSVYGMVVISILTVLYTEISKLFK